MLVTLIITTIIITVVVVRDLSKQAQKLVLMFLKILETKLIKEQFIVQTAKAAEVNRRSKQEVKL